VILFLPPHRSTAAVHPRAETSCAPQPAARASRRLGSAHHRCSVDVSSSGPLRTAGPAIATTIWLLHGLNTVVRGEHTPVGCGDVHSTVSQRNTGRTLFLRSRILGGRPDSCCVRSSQPAQSSLSILSSHFDFRIVTYGVIANCRCCERRWHNCVSDGTVFALCLPSGVIACDRSASNALGIVLRAAVAQRPRVWGGGGLKHRCPLQRNAEGALGY